MLWKYDENFSYQVFKLTKIEILIEDKQMYDWFNYLIHPYI